MNTIQTKNIDLEWFFGKITYIFFWLFSLYDILQIENNIIRPVGVFKFFNLGFLFAPEGQIILVLLSCIAIILYLSDKKMLLATGLMAIISVLAISYQDSNGIYRRNTHFAAIFLAQFIAYLIFHYYSFFQIKKNRIYFSLQIIVAIYFLAALSKLEIIGLDWFLHPENFSLQLYKNHFHLFADNNNCEHIIFANQIISFFKTYPLILKILLGISLSLEFFCFLILVNGKWRYPITLGLICMHIGISYLMGIGLSSIAMAVIAWMLNPIYLVYLLKERFFNKA